MTAPVSADTPPASVPRQRRRRGDLSPNPEMWLALRQGEGLTEVLTDFYERVFADPRLAPFFASTTRTRAIEKQYAFLREILTGEEGYFGDRPYNAHHWMVISDELFDYREDLMESCLRRHGLEERFILQFRAIDEVFRKQIVKSEPKPKKLRGEDLPLEGYGTIVVEIGTLCDDCQEAINAGDSVRYHLRTGQTFCPRCSSARETAA